ncbi:hypothetical protein DY000_02005611 [Brassica cretica]|uniref:Uncharacterized protein n=1 Tax=Brassica cretica TaxID=69181 RepID=A0ABQ7C9F6_BRACR|nr:hypothetical protein DY000_02005611 [Brassica cretica]
MASTRQTSNRRRPRPAELNLFGLEEEERARRQCLRVMRCCLYRGFEKPKERDCTAKKCISKMSQSCLYGRVFALLFQVRGNFVKPLKKQEEMWETNMNWLLTKLSYGI